MRTLRRNRQRMFYRIPLGKIPIVVEGMETGEYEELFSDPIGFYGYVGSQLKTALARAWGSDTSNNFAVLVVAKDFKDDNGNSVRFPNGTRIYRIQDTADSTADYVVDGVMDEELNETSYYLRKQI